MVKHARALYILRKINAKKSNCVMNMYNLFFIGKTAAGEGTLILQGHLSIDIYIVIYITPNVK